MKEEDRGLNYFSPSSHKDQSQRWNRTEEVDGKSLLLIIRKADGCKEPPKIQWTSALILSCQFLAHWMNALKKKINKKERKWEDRTTRWDKCKEVWYTTANGGEKEEKKK